jgi:drug/metabolite transporter (DMT)-like permease
VKSEDAGRVAANYAGMAIVNFFAYTVIPFFVTRSGATLLNLSNVTTILWSMLFDIMLYGSPFYPLCMGAFAIELIGIVLFSLRQPTRPEPKEQASTEMPESTKIA